MSNESNARQIQFIVARAAQFTGRRYPKLEAELSKLSVGALDDLARLIVDGQQEVQRVKNQAMREPWRMGR